MRTYDLTRVGDANLIRVLEALVARARADTAAIVAHIAEVDARRLHSPAGYPSMFAYCVGRLRLSEDAAHRRIRAARAARRFPAIFEALADGRLHLAAVCLLSPHLTPENARGRTRGSAACLGARIEEREGLPRVASCRARAPVAESRLRYDAERAEVERVADRNDGPCAGAHRMTTLELIARWVDHVPERYEVRVRYAGAYATRRRVWWRRRGIVLARASGEPPGMEAHEESWPALQARRRRWAERLRPGFRVDVEVCAPCGGEARILLHLERRGAQMGHGEHVGHREQRVRPGVFAAPVAGPVRHSRVFPPSAGARPRETTQAPGDSGL